MSLIKHTLHEGQYISRDSEIALVWLVRKTRSAAEGRAEQERQWFDRVGKDKVVKGVEVVRHAGGYAVLYVYTEDVRTSTQRTVPLLEINTRPSRRLSGSDYVERDGRRVSPHDSRKEV